MTEPVDRIPQGFPPEPNNAAPVPMILVDLAPEYYTDPLVTLPGVGFAGWRARFWLVARNNWKPLLGFSAIAVVIGYILRQLLVAVIVPRSWDMFGYSIVSRLGGLVIGDLTYAFAFAGAAYIIVTRAAGGTAGFSAGVRYTLRRFVPVFGLLVGNTFLVLLGACLGGVLMGGGLGSLNMIIFGYLVLGAWALYVTLAGSMIPAIVVTRFDGTPLRTSWRLFHKNLRAASGRLLLVRLLDIAPVIFTYGVILVLPRLSVGSGFVITSEFAISAVGTVIAVPAFMAMIVGSLLTYAEMRARTTPLLSRDLAFSMERGNRRAAPEPRDWTDWTDWKPDI